MSETRISKLKLVQIRFLWKMYCIYFFQLLLLLDSPVLWTTKFCLINFQYPGLHLYSWVVGQVRGRDWSSGLWHNQDFLVWLDVADGLSHSWCKRVLRQEQEVSVQSPSVLWHRIFCLFSKYYRKLVFVIVVFQLVVVNTT